MKRSKWSVDDSKRASSRATRVPTRVSRASRIILAVWAAANVAAAIPKAELNPAWPSDAASDVESDAELGPAPIGEPGWEASYRWEKDRDPLDSVVREFTLAWGPIQLWHQRPHQWIRLQAVKANGDPYRFWLLSAGYPAPELRDAQASIARYILQEGASPPREYRHRFSGVAVLPSLGGWVHLLPRAAELGKLDPATNRFPQTVSYLGHRYGFKSQKKSDPFDPPPAVQVIRLTPDALIGVPHNTRQKDGTRRYDDSDYELVRLTLDDYREMVEAGLNCLRVDAEQALWIRDLDVFYWGDGTAEMPYPECLYRSQYLGPTLFLDEPAVCTRDYVIRPRLREDAAYRRNLTPQIAFEAFTQYFREKSLTEAPWALSRGLTARSDVDLGDMELAQENLFSWETMVSSAAYQLSQDPRIPAAMVFEPPGRVGTLRTLPELNMTYGCQIPVDDPKNLTAIITGFLRGAARLTNKTWGMSIYGSVDRADAFWFLTHAYDLGATRFFFWDSHRLACVPYDECLALARALKAHAENRPHRDLERLTRSAEVAILLPPGYNLGHVQLGKGSLWGVGELNLERVNQSGVQYRTVMGHFFTEIEHCIRLGVAFDLLWDLPKLSVSGYREVVRIREDGKVGIQTEAGERLLAGPRTPVRPSGAAPDLDVQLSADAGPAPLKLNARATVTERSAPVYYTPGTDRHGVYHNAVVAWELFGPAEEDHRFLLPADLSPDVVRTERGFAVKIEFTLTRPGHYRLRAATVDMAGRTTCAWIPITVTP